MQHKTTIKIFLLITALLLAYAYSGSIFILASHHLNTDIMLTYLSGKMLNTHTPGYHFSQAYIATHHSKTAIIPNLSPPFSVMIAAFVTRYVSYQNFFIAFMTSTVLLNIWALTRLYQHFYTDKTKFNRLILTAFILANLFYWPAFMNTTFGQVALALNALIIFFYLALEKKCFIRAGFLLALAINMKLFFGVFLIYFFAKKQYQVLVAFLFFSLLFASIPLMVYGKSIYQGYFEALNRVGWYGVNWNASWYGFFARILGEKSHRFHSMLFSPNLGKNIYYSFFLIYATLIYYFTRKNITSSLPFAFTLSSMLLISPLGWSYYFPILITAFLITIIEAESSRYYVPLICLLLFSFFLSELPFPIYRDTEISSMLLVSKGNLFFISLLLFNTVNLFQLLLPNEKNQTPILTHKFKLLIFSICILPSIIGISGIIVSLTKGQPPEKETMPLASMKDLLPSNSERKLL
ncbi:MAG: glycosyltransferase family 87 protein [Pseudomonadota bacterium]